MLARMTTLAMTLVVAAGCQQTSRHADLRLQRSGSAAGLPPTLARMQEAYPDLHTGRFVCLADFNSQPQAALFRTLGPNGTQSELQPTINVRHSIDQTGAGGLQARLTGPQDELLFDGVRSEKLTLVRDWRDYSLLLFNIYGPPGGLMLEFSVQSGTDVPLRETRTLFAKPGWHLYRFDLAELGEEIDLADIRALCWRAPQVSGPVDLYFDDLILAENTRYLLGENAGPGQLYVVTRGRRIHVGVRRRFELAFCDGLIVAWHSDDEHNLTVRTGLGPWPVPLPQGWSFQHADPVVYDDPALYAGWGARVAAAQHVVEASETRVVIEGVWRFVADPADQPSASSPQHVWRYVIYPFGQVYLRASSHSQDATWEAPCLGYAVALDGRSGFTGMAPESAHGSRTPASFVLISQPGRDRPDFLWCLHEPQAAKQRLELISADGRRIAVTVGDVEPTDPVETAHLLRFWPRDIDAAPEAQSFAADYQQPAKLAVSRGVLVTDALGDLNHDGFNESEGCYELAPEDGLLRFRFLPGSLLRHQPTFRVRGTARATCWIYADGRIISRHGRDHAGRLLFTLPQAVGTPLTIEVNTRPAPSAP